MSDRGGQCPLWRSTVCHFITTIWRLADWHLPFFAERWLSEGEARRDALEYAVKPIDSGVLDEPRTWRDRPA